MLSVEEIVEVTLLRNQCGESPFGPPGPFDSDPDVDLHRQILLARIGRPVDPDEPIGEDELVVSTHTDSATGNVTFEIR